AFPGDTGPGPEAPLVQSTDGNFYGTTASGGTNHSGTVFKVDSLGNFTTLHSFVGAPADGSYPYAGLVQAADGNFYGTTSSGGNSRGCSSGCGTVFKIFASGALTIIRSLGYTVDEGVDPLAGLIQGSDGNFYGTTYQGGSSNTGT